MEIKNSIPFMIKRFLITGGKKLKPPKPFGLYSLYAIKKPNIYVELMLKSPFSNINKNLKHFEVFILDYLILKRFQNYLSVRAATPGKTFPSKNSKEAPPPVDT